jgi:hypothetical protein
MAVDGPPGITRPVVLPPFDAAAPNCHAPSGLKHVLAFAQDNQRKFMQGIARGLALAANDRGLEFRLTQAHNDAIKMIEQVQGFLNAKVGALVVAPVDPPSIAPHLRELIWSGAYVGTVVPPPALSSSSLVKPMMFTRGARRSCVTMATVVAGMDAEADMDAEDVAARRVDAAAMAVGAAGAGAAAAAVVAVVVGAVAAVYGLAPSASANRWGFSLLRSLVHARN